MKKLNMILLLLCTIAITACNKFLDAKPDKALVTPTKLSDLQALLDDPNINLYNPVASTVADDNYYLLNSFYNFIPLQYQEEYSWNPTANSNYGVANDWLLDYNKIYTTNTVLDNLEKVDGVNNKSLYNAVKGQAYYIRGYVLFDVTQLFTLPYKSGQDDPLGMPIRLSSDINNKVTRSTVNQTFAQIINDLKQASLLLPEKNAPYTRPGKDAAYAALANVYLEMQNYSSASKYVDSSLKINNVLIDFNTLDSTSAKPIPDGNSEVIYYSSISSVTNFNPSVYRVDSSLLKMYSENDLRKVIFYNFNTDKTATFKGQYGKMNSQALFSGLCVDELYLIKAECAARLNDLPTANSYLNALLLKRYKTGTFQPFNFKDGATALKTILDERRKELAFRGTKRWNDLRRLNLDPKFAVTLTRNLMGVTYTLPPNDLRYAFLIPDNAVTLSGLQQNKR